ncbi:MAG: glycosyltransferase family 2 protein [Alphaproteobacteria bacterium]|nr:glycosyltransferase family 2 protein [Alphaproteobacteria bacterium]
MSVRLSVLVVARNEETRLADCLGQLAFADERVVVLDRCTDGSAAIANRLADVVVEGAWPIEGDRRNTGLDACAGDWILEVDADESVSPELAVEIRAQIATVDTGYFLIPFLNYIGDRCVRYGWGASWGVSAAPRLSRKGAKTWGRQRIHPALELHGPKRWLTNPIKHQVDRDISDMIRRLDSYTTARAADLRDSGNIGSLPNNVRRFFSRFFKCYVRRKGYREGGYGFLIALFAGLYPLLSHLKARLESD